MSDLGNFVTLGIGPASDISHFVLVGLSQSVPVEPLLAEYHLTARTELADTVIGGTLFAESLDSRVSLSRAVGVRTTFRSTEKIAFEDD